MKGLLRPLLARPRQFRQKLVLFALGQSAPDRILEHARAIRDHPICDLVRPAALGDLDGAERVLQLARATGS